VLSHFSCVSFLLWRSCEWCSRHSNLLSRSENSVTLGTRGGSPARALARSRRSADQSGLSLLLQRIEQALRRRILCFKVATGLLSKTWEQAGGVKSRTLNQRTSRYLAMLFTIRQREGRDSVACQAGICAREASRRKRTTAPHCVSIEHMPG
jgi:hypothetical protein